MYDLLKGISSVFPNPAEKSTGGRADTEEPGFSSTTYSLHHFDKNHNLYKPQFLYLFLKKGFAWMVSTVFQIHIYLWSLLGDEGYKGTKW